MVCKGCGERLFGRQRDYCKSCRADLAASRPSEPLTEDSMAEPTQTEPTREERIAALAPLQEGYRYLYNRSAYPWEHQFDGRVYVFQPHEVKAVPCGAADLFRTDSLIPGTLRRMPGAGGSFTAERYIAYGPGWTIQGTVKV